MNLIRITASGLLWAAVYDAVWGIAWFMFMRAEWQAGFQVLGKPMLWTPELWAIWVIVTVPFGIAVAAYTVGRRPALRAWLMASFVMWLFVAGGSDLAFLQMFIPSRTIVFDTLVNLVSMTAAAFAATRFPRA